VNNKVFKYISFLKKICEVMSYAIKNETTLPPIREENRVVSTTSATTSLREEIGKKLRFERPQIEGKQTSSEKYEEKEKSESKAKVIIAGSGAAMLGTIMGFFTGDLPANQLGFAVFINFFLCESLLGADQIIKNPSPKTIATVIGVDALFATTGIFVFNLSVISALSVLALQGVLSIIDTLTKKLGERSENKNEKKS
jgi:hypothetical protein